MSSSIDGLQFPVHPKTQKSSSSQVGKEIIAEALSLVDHLSAQQALDEKTGVKIIQFILRHWSNMGFVQVITPSLLLNKVCTKPNIALISLEMDNAFFKILVQFLYRQIQSISFKGHSKDDVEWFVPYHGQKLQGEALYQQIQKWQDTGIIETSHADALREVIAS
jgi:hypothetical protein